MMEVIDDEIEAFWLSYYFKKMLDRAQDSLQHLVCTFI